MRPVSSLLPVLLAAFSLAGCASFMGSSGPPPDAEREPTYLGAQLVWGSDPNDLGIGVRAELPLSGFRRVLRGFGSVDFFFPEGPLNSQVDLNAGPLLPLRIQGFETYVGGGVNVQVVSATVLADRESGIYFGLAAWGGARFGTGDLIPFAEIRTELGQISQVVLSGGIVF